MEKINLIQMKAKIFSLFIVGIALFSSCTAQSGRYQNVSVDQLKEKLSDDIIVLDVRTPGEVAQGVIGDPKIIDFNGGEFLEAAKKLPKDKPIYVYCAVGGRSSSAAGMLAKEGFSNIYNVEGGIQAWQKKGFLLSKK